MSSSKFTYDLTSNALNHVVREEHVECGFIGKLQGLKYEYRSDIRDRAALERKLREKFEALSRVKLSDGEFARLLDEIVSPDVFTAAKTLRSINSFAREDGTPPNYTLVNIKDWCKNTFEVVKPLEVSEQDGNVLLNQRVAKGELVSKNVLETFLKQFFLRESYNEGIVATASGSTVKHSSNNVLLNMEVVLPCLEEQQRIADCLTSLDTLITAATQELETPKTHKKGLMQQLFPSAEAA